MGFLLSFNLKLNATNFQNFQDVQIPKDFMMDNQFSNEKNKN
jgi:hypothetical protein